MSLKLEDYIEIIGDQKVAELHRKARTLYGKHVLHFNATFIGGGVAEILSSLVPLMNDTGVDAGWRVLHGTPTFYDLTKKFHNALQGADASFSQKERKLYNKVNQEFASYTHIDHDCVIVHDPQPLPLIAYYKKTQPWIWRCHIDVTNPNDEAWQFVKRYMLRYDAIIISSEEYRKKDIPIDQHVICPAIDPLSPKNCDMTDDEIASYIKQAGIPTDKPIITQVSRMDKWKDPEGVLEVYEKVREKIDCRLVYCYNLASDDPEGMEIYTRIYDRAHKLVEAGDVVFVMGNKELLVNAVQRFSDVILQKSTREGFCLCVTESLWKGTPVVASRIGGIPAQIEDGKSGFLLDPMDYDGFADRVVELLKNKSLADELGNAGKETVREKFLCTRLMGDYLDLIGDLCG